MERVRVDTPKKKIPPMAVKGHKKVGGRQKGTGNKVPTEIKNAILTAMDQVGELEFTCMTSGTGKKKKTWWEWKATGKDGSTGYMRWLARHEPQTFAQLVGKLLPFQLSGKDGGAIKVEHEVFHRLQDRDLSKMTVLELTAMYREASSTHERTPLKLVGGKTIDNDAA